MSGLGFFDGNDEALALATCSVQIYISIDREGTKEEQLVHLRLSLSLSVTAI